MNDPIQHWCKTYDLLENAFCRVRGLAERFHDEVSKPEPNIKVLKDIDKEFSEEIGNIDKQADRCRDDDHKYYPNSDSESDQD